MSNIPVTQPDLSFHVTYNNDNLPFLFATRSSDNLNTMDGFFPFHWHPDLEFSYVAEGSITYVIGDEEIVLSQGYGIMISPRRIHTISADGENYGKYHLLIYHPNLLTHGSEAVTRYLSRRFLMNSPAYIILDPNVDWQKVVLDKIKEMETVVGSAEKNPIRMLTLAYDICACMCDRIEPSEIIEKDNDMQLTFLKMADFIRDNYSEKIDTDDIAKAGHVSRTMCNKLFQKYVHLSPIKYLTKYRLNRFAMLLRDSNLSLIDISVSCGFHTPNYCFAVFKREYGITPKQYRDKFLIQNNNTD